MRCASRLISRGVDERGSAALEFVALGLVLIVPLVYLVLVLGQLQAGSLAAEGAARQAAREFVQFGSLAQADQVAAAEIYLAASDFGFEPGQVSWSRSCEGTCLAPNSRATVRVVIRVPLPLVPPVLQLRQLSSVAVQASATQTVSRFGPLR